MKVVLLQDVAKVGRRFDVAEVPDGYALNKLIPKKLAKPATPENVKQVEAMAKKMADTVAGETESFTAAVTTLKDKTVSITVEANDEGNMFQALKPEAVVAAVKADAGLELQESWVQITTPIKSTGEHTILLSLGENQGEFSVNIVK